MLKAVNIRILHTDKLRKYLHGKILNPSKRWMDKGGGKSRSSMLVRCMRYVCHGTSWIFQQIVDVSERYSLTQLRRSEEARASHCIPYMVTIESAQMKTSADIAFLVFRRMFKLCNYIDYLKAGD